MQARGTNQELDVVEVGPDPGNAEGERDIGDQEDAGDDGVDDVVALPAADGVVVHHRDERPARGLIVCRQVHAVKRLVQLNDGGGAGV